MDLKKKSLALSVVNGLRFTLAFVFQILLARHFGLSAELDCLFVALTVFTFAGMAHLFVTSLFIPLFNELKENSAEDGYLFADVVMKWGVGLSLVVLAAFWAAGEPMISWFASGLDPARMSLSFELSKLFLYALVLQGISMTSVYILNALYHFSIPALSGLLHPVSNIIFLIFLAPRYGIFAIAYAAVFSNILQVVLLVAYLTSFTPWKPTRHFYHRSMKALVAKSSSAAASGVLWDLREVISRQICSYLPVGSVALMAYAEKFVYLIHNIAVSPVAKVFFSRVSALIAAGAREEARQIFNRIYMGNTVILAWITANVIVYFVPMLSLFFLDSRFSLIDIHHLYGLMMILVFQVFAQGYGDYHARVLFSEQRVSAVMKIRISGILFFAALTPLLSWWRGVFGIAAGFSLAQILVYILSHAATQPVLHLRMSAQGPILIRCLAVCALMVGAGMAAQRLVPSLLVSIAVVFPIWNLVFAVIAGIVMKNELRSIWYGLQDQRAAG